MVDKISSDGPLLDGWLWGQPPSNRELPLDILSSNFIHIAQLNKLYATQIENIRVLQLTLLTNVEIANYNMNLTIFPFGIPWQNLIYFKVNKSKTTPK